jgi:hypothetical protein
LKSPKTKQQQNKKTIINNLLGKFLKNTKHKNKKEKEKKKRKKKLNNKSN